jgi:hypothetical protein
MEGGKDSGLCRIMDHVGWVCAVAVLAYSGGCFELEQSDIIHTLLPTGPLDRQGEDHVRNVVSSGQVLQPDEANAVHANKGRTILKFRFCP